MESGYDVRIGTCVCGWGCTFVFKSGPAITNLTPVLLDVGTG